jgi:hypothetical protein
VEGSPVLREFPVEDDSRVQSDDLVASTSELEEPLVADDIAQGPPLRSVPSLVSRVRFHSTRNQVEVTERARDVESETRGEHDSGSDGARVLRDTVQNVRDSSRFRVDQRRERLRVEVTGRDLLDLGSHSREELPEAFLPGGELVLRFGRHCVFFLRVRVNRSDWLVRV